MALPDLNFIPLQTSETPRIRMPGGTQLSPLAGLDSGDKMTSVRDLIAQINAALTPLMPVFNLIDAVIALKECVEAIPSLATNPKALYDALQKLISAVTGLATVVPAASVPIMVGDIIKLLVFMLIALKFELSAFIEQSLRVDRAAVKAAMAGNGALLSVVEKAQQNLTNTKANTKTSMQPIDRLITLVNTLLDIAQVPNNIRLPTIGDLADDAQQALTVIDDLIEVLQAIADKLPI